MVAIARERGGEDNITVILSHFSGSSLSSPVDAGTVTGTLEKIHEFNHAKGSGYDDQITKTSDDLETAPLDTPETAE